MQCLLAHRRDADMNTQCLSYIDHYEIMSMRDYNLTPVFAQTCKADIEKHCVGKGQAVDK